MTKKGLTPMNTFTPVDPNSALVWLPPIVAAGLPVPRTEIVKFSPSALYPILDGEEPEANFSIDTIHEACRRIGYPAFLRTDLSSAKHDGPRAYRVGSEEDLWKCVYLTFESNALKDLACQSHAFLVREFITIPSIFTAFAGLPIGREWRIFANQESVLCEHFYWPQKAFESWSRWLPETWKADLKQLAEQRDGLEDLKTMALRAAQAVGHGSWSVDFAQDAAGKWWLIDMALAAASWHPDHNPGEEALPATVGKETVEVCTNNC
jgi:hypothetical protein